MLAWSLLLELEASKDEVSSLHSQAGKDKEAMEEDYQNALELIFSYGYRCCAYKHIICGDLLGIQDGRPDSTDLIPPEFFCEPTTLTTIESQGCRGRFGRSGKGSRGTWLTSFPMLVLVIFGDFLQGVPFCHQYAYYFL